MKALQAITILLLVFLLFTSPVHSEIIIDDGTKNQIVEKLSDAPSKVFQLDLKENAVCFNQIDRWFNKRIKFDNVYLQNKRDGRRVTRLRLSEDIRILTDGSILKGPAITDTSYAWYVREPRRRIFFKESQTPVQQYLPDDMAIQVARDFIVGNAFCKITGNDSFHSAHVMTRKRLSLIPGTKVEDAVIIFYRVEFKREFFGMEVFNSKQVVYLHPDTREILSYKNIMWTPVDEETGRDMSRVTAEDVFTQIQEAFAGSEGEHTIAKVTVGMYQTDTILFPVLRVHLSRNLPKSDAIPIQEVLMIHLVEGIDVGKKQLEIRRPVKIDKKGMKKTIK